MHEPNHNLHVSPNFLNGEIHQVSVISQLPQEEMTSLRLTLEFSTAANIPAWVVDVVDLVPLCELTDEGRIRFDHFFNGLEEQIRKRLLECTRAITWQVLQAAVDAEIRRDNEAA